MSAAAGRRAASAALVALYLTCAGVAVPDEAQRGALHYLVVATLGYGHLLGALRLRPGPLSQERALRGACLAVALANAWLLYGLAVERWPALVLGLLAVSVWHSAENDLALEGAAGPRLGPLPRAAGPQLAALGVTLLVVALAGGALGRAGLGPALAASALVAVSPALAAAAAGLVGMALLARGERRRLGALLAGAGGALSALGVPSGVAFADVFAAATLHHLVSWLLLLGSRVRAAAGVDPAEARRLLRRLGACHAAPVALLWLLPSAGPEAAALRAALLAPGFYLFVSVLHVAQTARARGLAPRQA